MCGTCSCPCPAAQVLTSRETCFPYARSKDTIRFYDASPSTVKRACPTKSNSRGVTATSSTFLLYKIKKKKKREMGEVVPLNKRHTLFVPRERDVTG